MYKDKVNEFSVTELPSYIPAWETLIYNSVIYLEVEEETRVPPGTSKKEVEDDLLGHYFWLEERYNKAAEEKDFEVVPSDPVYKNKGNMHYFYLTIKPRKPGLTISNLEEFVEQMRDFSASFVTKEGTIFDDVTGYKLCKEKIKPKYKRKNIRFIN